MLRPRHVNAGPPSSACLSKKLSQEVEQIQTEHPEAAVELWAMDEHRIGLKPLLQRIWVRKGSRPLIQVQQRYEWLYLSGFVHPHSGRTEWLILPTVDIETMNLALTQFACAVGANAQKLIALVMDQVGWHANSHVQIPEGLASPLFTALLLRTPAE